MNLNNIVAPFTAVVNPRELITIYPSTGSTTNSDGSRVPAYGAGVSVLAQIQDLSSKDLSQISGLNLQGQNVNAYLPGNWNGVIRADKKGGDLVTRADGSKWLMTMIPEQWGDSSGWVKVILTKQLN